MQIVGPKVKLLHIKRIAGEETPDGQEISWATPVRFEAVMTMLKGSEVLTYQQMKVNAKYKIWTNYLGISEKDRIVYGSVTYNVELVDPSFMMDKIVVILLNVKI